MTLSNFNEKISSLNGTFISDMNDTLSIHSLNKHHQRQSYFTAPSGDKPSWLSDFLKLPNEMKLEILTNLSVNELVKLYVDAYDDLGEYIIEIAFFSDYGFRRIIANQIRIDADVKEIEKKIADLGKFVRLISTSINIDIKIWMIISLMTRLFGIFSRDLFASDIFKGKKIIRIYSRFIQEYTCRWSFEDFEHLFFKLTNYFDIKDWFTKVFDTDHGTHNHIEFFLRQFLNLFIHENTYPAKLLKIYISNFSIEYVATLIQLQFSYTIIDDKDDPVPKILWAEDQMEDILTYGFRYIPNILTLLFSEREDFNLTEKECNEILLHIMLDSALPKQASALLLAEICNEFAFSFFLEHLEDEENFDFGAELLICYFVYQFNRDKNCTELFDEVLIPFLKNNLARNTMIYRLKELFANFLLEEEVQMGFWQIDRTYLLHSHIEFSSFLNKFQKFQDEIDTI